MQVYHFVSVKLTICLILGIILGRFLHLENTPISILLIISLGTLLVVYKHSKLKNSSLFGFLALLVTLLVGVFVTTIANPKNYSSYYENQLPKLEGTWKFKIKEILKPSLYAQRYIVAAKSIDDKAVSGRLLLQVSKDSLAQQRSVDDELLFVGKANGLRPPLNPYEFDYKAYLNKQGVYHQIRANSNELVLLAKESKTLFGIASNFRDHLIAKLHQREFGANELSIIQALLLGQRNDLDPETYNNYKDAGAVHILAVSGLHVGIILILLQYILRPVALLPKGKTLKLATIILLLWGFAFVAGLSASIVRAVTMFSFLAYAQYLNRPTNTFNIIALSMFFVLLVAPNLLFNLGFQMSYTAVFAIVWIFPKMQRFWYPENKLMLKVWQLTSVSIAAQLGVLPLSLYYFHQFPALFILSNLLIIPFLGLILGTGFLVLTLLSANALPTPLETLFNSMIKSMNSLIAWVAKQEQFIMRDISFDGIELLLVYFIIFLLVRTLTIPKFKRLALLLFCVVTWQLWSIFVQVHSQSKNVLVVGHQVANSILLYQQGNDLTIMASKNAKLDRLITDYKIAERIQSLDTSSIQNSYQLMDKSILVLDSTGVYPSIQKPDYLILSQSPRINLERLLDSLQPKMVIVDGSNYKSLVSAWHQTCKHKQTPFHYTGEKGAFTIHLVN